jgi:hypothetical protein
MLPQLVSRDEASGALEQQRKSARWKWWQWGCLAVTTKLGRLRVEREFSKAIVQNLPPAGAAQVS